MTWLREGRGNTAVILQSVTDASDKVYYVALPADENKGVFANFDICVEVEKPWTLKPNSFYTADGAGGTPTGDPIMIVLLPTAEVYSFFISVYKRSDVQGSGIHPYM